MLKGVIILLSIFAIIIFFVLIISFIANIFFNQKVKKEVINLFNSNLESKKEIIRKEDMERLPYPVQRWLNYSQVIGKVPISTVYLKQKAYMRLKIDKPWMPTEAEQYFRVKEPGFIWKAKIKAAPLVDIVGRDKYDNGKGNMLIKALSLVKVADASGKELDQGTLLRYLAETVWFPTAVLSSYIKWEEIDANSARATMNYGGVSASGVFTVNEKGEAINFEAKRYMESSGEYVMKTWSVSMKDYKEFNHIRIPTNAEVTWKLETGDFSWYKLEITEVEYNKFQGGHSYGN